jgi:lactose/L-arabinose transport system ATP-binding protein
MNFASGKVLERSAEGVSVALDGSDSPPVPARLGTRLEPGARVVMGMRPEHVEVAADGIGIPVLVEMEEDLGGVSYLHGRLESGQGMVIERRGNRENFEGRRVAVTIPPDRALLFNEAGERVR